MLTYLPCSHYVHILTFQNMFAGLAPVMSSFGIRMLKKMGWKEGTALGRAGIGRVEPIELSVKVDRQGWCVLVHISPSSPSVSLAL